MTFRFAVVHEAEADFATATELADREVLEAVNDWLDEHLLESQREWVGQTPTGERLTWSNLKRLALAAGVTPMGHFGREPAFPDARAARRAIEYLIQEMSGLSAIVLSRDQDDEPERRKGLDQAREHDHSGMVIVIGFAVVEREAWVISGFEPQDAGETARLDAERAYLGFHPCERSHELTACKDDAAKRSPKRVLHALSNGDHDRQRRCWTETSLAVLRTRGVENGLATYLREVRERLAPLIGHVPDH
jgi:hypothetical protein